MSPFAAETLGRALADLRGRRARLEAFIHEARELDGAIREMERVCRKLGITSVPGRPDQPTIAAVEAPKPRHPPRDGTNAERLLKALQDHPRGLNTTVLMREADVAAGSVSPVLKQLEAQGHIVKVGRGFWRASASEAAEVA